MDDHPRSSWLLGLLIAGAALLGTATWALVSAGRTDDVSLGRAVTAGALHGADRFPPESRRRPSRVPSAASLERAQDFARARGGLVSFAVVDSRGDKQGFAEDRRFVSASVVKAMLLAAELRRLAQTGSALDPQTKATLRAMITHSDNDAADTIYYRVGDEGLNSVASAAGMERFTVAGYWGNAEITAADMASFFSKLEAAMSTGHRRFALGLLGSVIPAQQWGIPAAAGKRWAVRLKGGWRQTELGSLAHQAAELRAGSRKLSMAVLTDGQPSHAYATETIRGVAERLLAAPPKPDR